MPVTLVGTSSEMTRSDALKLEYRVKQLPSSKKKIELARQRAEKGKGKPEDRKK